MGEFTLGYGDIGYSASFTGGTWTGELDYRMLNRQLITAVARTLDLTPLVLDITQTVAEPIDVLGVVNHNLTPSGTYRWTAYSDPSRTTLVYDSGTISAGTYYDYMPNKTTCDRIDSPVNTSYWRLELNDPTNPDGYMQMGRLFMGKRFVPSKNMDYGLKMGISEDNTSIIESPTGIESFVDAPNKRTATFSLSLIGYDIGDNFYRMALRDGIVGACLFDFDPDDKNEGMRTFICRQRTLTPLDYPSYDVNTLAVNLVEII